MTNLIEAEDLRNVDGTADYGFSVDGKRLFGWTDAAINAMIASMTQGKFPFNIGIWIANDEKIIAFKTKQNIRDDAIAVLNENNST